MTNELSNWHRAKKKPILVTEYGADTVAGLHRDPSYIFTEDYQTEFMREYFKACNLPHKQYWYHLGHTIGGDTN